MLPPVKGSRNKITISNERDIKEDCITVDMRGNTVQLRVNTSLCENAR